MSHAGNDELKEQVFEEGVIEPCVVCSMIVVFESSKENDYEEYEVEEETGDIYNLDRDYIWPRRVVDDIR